jgi:hypothetical protein
MHMVERVPSSAPGRLPALILAALMSLPGLCAASAQTTKVVVNDFTGLDGAESILVVDDAGHATKGHLLRFSPDQLTIKVDGRDLVFDRQQVTSIHAVGDSLNNGMLIGQFTGVAIGVAAGLGSECGGFLEPARPCDSGEKFVLAGVGGALFGAAGLGIGIAVDALWRDRRLVYHKAQQPGVATISIVPALAPSGARMLLTMAW